MPSPKGAPKGSNDLRSHPVAMLLLLRKTRGKKRGMRRTYFRSWPLLDRASSGKCLFRSRDWRHFRSKGPTRTDIAQNILPDRARDWHHLRSRDWRHFLSPVTWLPVAPHTTSQMRLCPCPYTTNHIYKEYHWNSTFKTNGKGDPHNAVSVYIDFVGFF